MSVCLNGLLGLLCLPIGWKWRRRHCFFLLALIMGEKCSGDHVLDKSALYTVARPKRCSGDHVLDKSALYTALIASVSLSNMWMASLRRVSSKMCL